MPTRLKTHHFSLLLTAISLTACGGGDSNSSPTEPILDTSAPIVKFEPETLAIASGETGSAALSATDNTGVQTGPTVTCTEGGSYVDSIFTAPAVNTETISVCTATASDSAGNAGTATLTVTIAAAAPNQAPMADARVNKTIISEGQPFTLDASNSSDPEGSALEYSWTQTEGPEVQITDNTNVTLSLDAPLLDSDETLVFEITVSDGEDESRQSVSIFVEALNTLTIAGGAPENTGNIYLSRIAGITAPAEGGFRTHWSTQSFGGTSFTASQLFDDMMQRVGTESTSTIRAITTPEIGILRHAVQSGERTYYIHQTQLHTRDNPVRRGFAILSNRPEGDLSSVGTLIADGSDDDIFPVDLEANSYSKERLISAIRIAGREQGDLLQIDSFIHFPDGTQIKTSIVEPTSNGLSKPAIASASETSYLVAWVQSTADPETSPLFGRLVTEDGTQTQNTFTIGDPLGKSYFPVMTRLSDGRILVVWNEGKDFSVDQTLSIKGRILNPDGTFATDIFTVFTTEKSTDVLGFIKTTAMQNGQSLITWRSERRDEIDANSRIQSLAIGSNGEPVSNIFNIYHEQLETNGDPLNIYSIEDIEIAISANNRAVIGWNFFDFDTIEYSFYSDFYPVGQ